jgi:hypothetical protein
MKNLVSFKSFALNEKEAEETFSFSELSPTAKKHAIDELRDTNVDYNDWHEPIIEDFENEMEELGLTDVEVQYSGFYSQGDGASFTADVGDPEVFMRMALGIESDKWVNMDDHQKPADEELDLLRSDLLDIGFDSREKLTPENFVINIIRNPSRYSHENTIEGDVDIENIPESIEDDFPRHEYIVSIKNKVTDWARKRSSQLYRDLERYYDELRSDDAVEETIEGNDYKFTKDGDLA